MPKRIKYRCTAEYDIDFPNCPLQPRTYIFSYYRLATIKRRIKELYNHSWVRNFTATVEQIEIIETPVNIKYTYNPQTKELEKQNGKEENFNSNR